MDRPADVRFVDAHAERLRGNEDGELVVLELRGDVGLRGSPPLVEPSCGLTWASTGVDTDRRDRQPDVAEVGLDVLADAVEPVVAVDPWHEDDPGHGFGP